MKKILLAIIICLILNLVIFSQTNVTPDFSTIKTEKGMMVLNRNKAQPFTFLVPGKNPQGSQNSDGSLLISTESGGLFVYFVKTSEFLQPNKKYPHSEILAAHRDWDISVQESALKAKLSVDENGVESLKIFNHKAKIETVQNISTIYWSYPSPNPQVQNWTFFQTVIIGDLVLMIGTTFEKSVKTDEVRKFFKATLESITLLPPQNVTAKKGKIKKK